MFKRIGMPEKAESIDFNGAGSVEAKCPHCQYVLGRVAGGMLKPRSANIIVVASSRHVCQNCQKVIERLGA